MNRISIYCIFFRLFKIWFIIRITTTSHTITKWNRHKNRTKHNKQYHINCIFKFTFHIFTFTKKLRISPILCHNYITSSYTYQFSENRYWEKFKFLPTPYSAGRWAVRYLLFLLFYAFFEGLAVPISPFSCICLRSPSRSQRAAASNSTYSSCWPLL